MRSPPLAHPTRPVIALLGDGAMQMNGLDALITIAHSWRQWADPRLVVMVLRSDDLSLVGGSLGGRMFVPAFPYADFAQLLGLVGVCIDAPDGIGTAWDAALAADRPVLLEVVTDPNVPLAPPQVTGQRLQAQPAVPPSTPSAPVLASRGTAAGESEAGEEDPGAALDSMSGVHRHEK
jgi:pyruvate dehydrogenase (quinone)